jgi:hypothetical protein
MKRLLLLTAIFLTACGPSQKEREDVASVTCSIMSETRNMDGAVRVEKINDAREKIGGEPFLGGDSSIKESFEYGLCQQLILNVNYDTTLQLLKDAEREIEAEKREEEQRLAAERYAAYAAVEDTLMGEWVFDDQVSFIFKRGGVGESEVQVPPEFSDKIKKTHFINQFSWNINIEDSPFHLDILSSEIEIPSLKVIFEVNNRNNLRMGVSAAEGKRPNSFSEADEILLGTRR